MEFIRYFYKRTLENSHSDYGIVAESVEECPIGKVKQIGCACTYQSCCEGNARFMRIKEDQYSWIMCEETTKMMMKNPLLGEQSTCVVGWV